MELDLSDEEAAALRELLDSHLSDMYAEISHTDNPGFRSQLRTHRELIREVRAKLDGKPI